MNKRVVVFSVCALLCALATIACAFVCATFQTLPAGVSIDAETGVADLTALEAGEVAELWRGGLSSRSDLTSVVVDATTWSADDIVALAAEIAPTPLAGTCRAGNLTVALDATEIDASTATSDDLMALAALVPALPNLTLVNAGEEEGVTKLAAITHLVRSAPDALVTYAFWAFGIRIDVHETTLDFRYVPMDDQGDAVKDIMAAMPRVDYLLMEGTGVDDGHMLDICVAFPATQVIW